MWSSRLLLFRSDVKGLVAEREGHAIIWVIHHAVHTLGALLEVPWGDALVEPALLAGREEVVAVHMCEMGYQR